MTKVAEDITEIKTDVKWLIAYQKEHRAEHNKMRMLVNGAFISAVISILLAFVL
jgi:hypothetical protein